MLKSIVSLFTFLLFIILIQSCVSTKKVIEIDDNQHSNNLSSTIDGVYYNADLWLELHKIDTKLIRFREREYIQYADSAKIVLKFDEKYLTASIYENDSLREFLQYKAKIKNDYLSIKRNYKLFPFPLFYLYTERKTVLTKDPIENSLILKTGCDEIGYVLIMGNGHSDRYMKKYTAVR